MAVKRVVMLLATGTLSPVVMAASMELYGTVNLSADFYGGAVVADNRYAVSSNQSHAGFSGQQRLDRGLALIYQWEAEMDWGSTDGVSHSINEQRDTFIGLSGQWGSVRAGRQQTPLMQIGRRYDLFSDSIGDARATYNQTGQSEPDGALVTSLWDQRQPGLLSYQSPADHNWQARLAYASIPGEINQAQRDLVGLGTGFSLDDWQFDAGFERHANTRQQNARAWRLGTAYQSGPITLTGFYQRARQSLFLLDSTATAPAGRSTVEVWGVGGFVQHGAQRWKAQLYQTSGPGLVNEDGARQWALGMEQRLSRQTYVYSVLAYMDNQSGTGYYRLGQNAGAGRMAPASPEQGNKHHAFSVGLRHHF